MLKLNHRSAVVAASTAMVISLMAPAAFAEDSDPTSTTTGNDPATAQSASSDSGSTSSSSSSAGDKTSSSQDASVLWDGEKTVMFFKNGTSLIDTPNKPQLELMEEYFAWKRQQPIR